jgi:hypothetical protein
MHTWSTLLRLHLPQWLAKESASAWIMAGTLTGAGAAAVALSGTQSPLPTTQAIHASIQRVPLAQSTPSSISPCQTITVSDNQSGCVVRFWHERHHWYGDDRWEHRQDQSSPEVTPYAVLTDGTVNVATQ